MPEDKAIDEPYRVLVETYMGHGIYFIPVRSVFEVFRDGKRLYEYNSLGALRDLIAGLCKPR